MFDRGKVIRRRLLPDEEPAFPETMHPVLRRVFAARRIRSADELDHSLGQLLPFESLSGIDQATGLLQRALEEQWRILVVGDFDADGATSTAVAVRGLKLMGVEGVDFLVPNRFEFGYGLTPEIVEVALGRGPQLIITVDNGISSLQGVAAAKQAGVAVLVTDHHLPGEQLPAADAIVNPNVPGDPFPAKSLAGVGVIFYVMMALRARLRECGWFEAKGLAEPNLGRLLDLVALGTVADVVPLEQNNRILVAQGLARMRAGELSPGIQALIEVSGRQSASVVAADLGFALGPRLNAAGRLDDMSLGICCLLSDSLEEARPLAAQLDLLNRERRDIEQGMRGQAMKILARMHLEQEQSLPVGLCLYSDTWHQGVIGILASRIKEQLHRPVIALADGASEGELKGSARSVPGLHIRDALDAVAARHPGLLTKFGGHAMAAGLSLPRENLKRFSAAFDEEVRRYLDEEELHGVLHTDGELSALDADMQLAEALRLQVPWGQEFPEPLFEGTFDLMHHRVVGERHLKMVLRWPGEERTVEAIAFNAVEDDGFEPAARLFLAYRLDVNEYRGERKLQLVVEYMQPL